jgi:hypothetical protein
LGSQYGFGLAEGFVDLPKDEGNRQKSFLNLDNNFYFNSFTDDFFLFQQFYWWLLLTALSAHN